jgi:hypothetical protein
MNIWAILVATLAAFIASSIYYVIFAKQRAKLSTAAATKPSPLQGLAELLRNIILAFVLAYLVGLSDTDNTIGLSLLLWVGFPMILLAGSVMYEKAPAKLAVIHAGDWLIKLLIMTTMLSAWK